MAKSRTNQTITGTTGSVKPSGTTDGDADQVDPRPSVTEKAYSTQTDLAMQAAMKEASALLNRRDAASERDDRWKGADARGTPSEMKIIEKELYLATKELRAAKLAVAAARGDFFGDFQQAPQSKRKVPEPVQRRQAAQEAILAEIRHQGHNPRALPQACGKRGVKAAIKAALGTHGIWALSTVFDHAWDNLRKAGDIADASNERRRPIS